MPQALKDWWPVILVVMNFLGMWIMWSMSKKFMTREDCSKCAGGIGDRVATLEKQKTCVDIKLDSLPQVETLHEISLRQEQLSGEIAALKATIDGLKELLKRLERPLDLMVEGHLNGKGGKL